jgi:hypothetical protein
VAIFATLLSDQIHSNGKLILVKPSLRVEVCQVPDLGKSVLWKLRLAEEGHRFLACNEALVGLVQFGIKQVEPSLVCGCNQPVTCGLRR